MWRVSLSNLPSPACSRRMRGPPCRNAGCGGSASSKARLEAPPALESARGLRHVGRRAGVAETHVAAAALRIEVDAGSGGNTDVGQHLPGEGNAVGREVADV